MVLVEIGYADTFTSVNGGGAWDDPSTWDKGSVPGVNDDVIILGDDVYFEGASNHIIIRSLSMLEDGGVYASLFTDGDFIIENNYSCGNYADLNIGGTLTVNGSYSFGWNSSLTTGGSCFINSDFQTDGTCNISGDLNVLGNFVNGDSRSCTVGNDLIVEDDITNNGTLNIGGDIIVNSGGISNNYNHNINVNGSVVSENKITNEGDFIINGYCEVNSGGFENKYEHNFIAGDYVLIAGDLVNSGDFVSGGNLDVDGSITNNYQQLIVVNGDLIKDGNLTSDGYLVIAEDFISNGGETTIDYNGDIYVFGSIDCTIGDCNDIQDIENWLSTTPGLSYLSSVTTEITTTGTGSITLSEDATIVVECWGAGGSGADVSSNNTQGGGGGGGAYASSILDLNADTYNYYVGSGSSTSDAGEDTWFQSDTDVMAKGGSSVPINGTTGAAGGSATASRGDTKFSGGDGADAITTGNSKTSGGGGSSAGFSMNGRDGINQAGGEAPIGGGDGGDGGDEDFDGNSGEYPGGGGGGSATKTTSRNGGAGADGKIVITISTSPMVYFSNASSEVDEDAGTISIAISLTETSSSLVTVPYTITGSAIEGSDYTIVSSSESPIEFPAGSQTQYIEIEILDDGEYEEAENIIFNLNTPSNAVLGSPKTHNLVINDDDPEPSLILSVIPSSICFGDTFTLSTTGAKCKDINDYQYSTDEGGSWNNITGTAGLCVTPHIPESSGTYQYKAKDGKNNNESNTVTVSVNPLPQGILSANGPFCAPATGQLTWTATKGTGPFEIVYNDGTTDYTVTDVYSGTPFDVEINPVSSTTTYTLQSVTDANGCSRSTGFTTASATIEIEPLSASAKQVTADYECPQLISDYGFNPNNDGPYNPGSSEIMFAVILNEPASEWDFSFDIEAKYDGTSVVIDSVNILGTHYDLTGTSPYSYTDVPQEADSVGVHAWVKNVPGEQVKVIFDVSEISDDNCTSTFNAEKRDTVIMNIMPVVGRFE